MQSEADIQEAIIKVLLLKKFLVIRFNSGAAEFENGYVKFYIICNDGTSAGLTDLGFGRDGKFWFVEIKTRKGKSREAQLNFKRLAEQYGMTYLKFNNSQAALDFVNNL